MMGSHRSAGDRKRTGLRTLVVRRAVRLPGESGPRGHVKLGTLTLACALGRTGITYRKREGDKATPAGTMRLRDGYYRSDKMPRPVCQVPLRPSTRHLGWCDDTASSLYNRPAPLPLTVGHEAMWRQDVLYDVVVVLDWNITPRRVGRGSAIFLHCAKPGFTPTLGCVAIAPGDMRRLLPRLARDARMIVR
jgi:L,D-peptidoglycan transpeptidase YkuD (ErfK/YbiS/YcfS/YnhG family)